MNQVALALDEMEAEFGIVLPPAYRDAMLQYPLAGDGQEPLLHADVAVVRAANQCVRERGFRGSDWPSSLFIVGGNQAGDVYFIDLSRDPSPVFAVTHEMEGFEPHDIDRFVQSQTFSIWVEELVSGQEWFREVQERRRRKRWWQFWI